MTHKRGVAVVMAIWLFSVVCRVGVAVWLLWDNYLLIALFPGIVGVVLTTLVYIRIYFTARRHKNQIQALRVQGTGMTRWQVLLASLNLQSLYSTYISCF